MMQKLKPCPFCGAQVRKAKGSFNGTTGFVCDKCGADVRFYGAEYDPIATEAWNRRFEDDS